MWTWRPISTGGWLPESLMLEEREMPWAFDVIANPLTASLVEFARAEKSLLPTR